MRQRTIGDITEWWNTLLKVDQWHSVDNSFNGLQVGEKGQKVDKIAFAVDACLATFQKAKEQGAQLLCVHHGLFWGGVSPIVSDMYQRIQFLQQHDLALYASHLPLDAHEDVGNNVAIARHLGCEDMQIFGKYKGKEIGIRANFLSGSRLKDIEECFDIGQGQVTCFDFGKKDEIKDIMIVSGAAASMVHQAIDANCDLFISGEPSHEVYHTCLENQMSALFLGHYVTECFGPKALMNVTEKERSIQTVFIDVPTGL